MGEAFRLFLFAFLGSFFGSLLVALIMFRPLVNSIATRNIIEQANLRQQREDEFAKRKRL